VERKGAVDGLHRRGAEADEQRPEEAALRTALRMVRLIGPNGIEENTRLQQKPVSAPE